VVKYHDCATVLKVTLESVLGSVSFFEHLRPDELARIAHRFECRRLQPGEVLRVEPELGAQRLVVVVSGEVALEVEARGRTLRSVLVAGDRFGDVGLLAKLARRSSFTARESAEVALLDAAGLDAVIAEFPAIAPPLAEELATEVSFANDLVRQLLELWAEGLSPDQRTAALAERRAALERRGAKVARSSVGALFRRAVVERGAEPPFWATVGFLVALAGARLVVALILKYGLEKRLFALVPRDDPHPMHVHHFNYGLALIGAAGLAALFPLGRRALRALAFAFGAGAGLVFDEFALFWNLNPEYAQTLSLYSAAIALVVLANLTWFREFWAAVFRRAWYRAGGGR
jgi:CRP-like cAMP-binding protein